MIPFLIIWSLAGVALAVLIFSWLLKSHWFHKLNTAWIIPIVILTGPIIWILTLVIALESFTHKK